MKRDALPGEVIDHGENAKSPPRGSKLVRHEIHRPTFVWPARLSPDLFALTDLKRQLLLSVDPSEFFLIHFYPFPGEQAVELTVTPPPALLGEFLDASNDGRVINADRFVPKRTSGQSKQPAGTPLAHRVTGSGVTNHGLRLPARIPLPHPIFLRKNWFVGSGSSVLRF